jgi:mannose-6-phosphate isomerase-like protein (cupin superfamily)
MSGIASTKTRPHYRWGNGCDGWRLLSNDKFSIIQESMPPNTEEVWHYHKEASQFFYVLSGQLKITTRAESHSLVARQGLEVLPTTPHQVSNSSGEVVSFLLISVPSTSDDRINLQPPVGEGTHF